MLIIDSFVSISDEKIAAPISWSKPHEQRILLELSLRPKWTPPERPLESFIKKNHLVNNLFKLLDIFSPSPRVSWSKIMSWFSSEIILLRANFFFGLVKTLQLKEIRIMMKLVQGPTLIFP